MEGAERRKCLRGNARKCPMFVEMQNPVQKFSAPRLSFRLTFWTPTNL
jgi:hypothetical protein